MAYDFPNSPTNGQEYTSGSITFVWNGYGWTVKGGAALVDLYVNTAGDTMTGPLVLNADPTAALEPATKQYVDSRAGNDPTKVLKAGDTMTGNLTIQKVNPAFTLSGSGNPNVWINKTDVVGASDIYGGINGVAHWYLRLGEGSAANAFSILAANDAGTITSTPLRIDRATGAATFLSLTTNYLSLGSAVAPGGPTDLTRHISLYGNSFGFSITSNTLNIVRAGSRAAWFDGNASFQGSCYSDNGRLWGTSDGTPLWTWQGTPVWTSGSTMTGRLVNTSSAGWMNDASGSQGAIEVQGASGQGAKMAFHHVAQYAAYFGISQNNAWSVGGWSMGGNMYRIVHEGLDSPQLVGTLYASGGIQSGAHIRSGNGYFYGGWGGQYFFFDGTNWQSPWGSWYVGGYWVAREQLNATFAELYSNNNHHSNGNHYFLAGDGAWIRWRGDLGKIDTSHGWVIPNIDSSGSIGTTNYIYSRCGYYCKDGEDCGLYTFNISWATGVPGGTMFIGAVNVGQTLNCDYRIKRDIEPLPSLWDRVKALRPIKYKIKEYTPDSMKQTAVTTGRPFYPADDREHWGFAAHEMQEKLLPTAASGSKDDPNVLQSPNMLAIVAALTKALQEAMLRIEQLEEGAIHA